MPGSAGRSCQRSPKCCSRRAESKLNACPSEWRQDQCSGFHCPSKFRTTPRPKHKNQRATPLSPLRALGLPTHTALGGGTHSRRTQPSARASSAVRCIVALAALQQRCAQKHSLRIGTARLPNQWRSYTCLADFGANRPMRPRPASLGVFPRHRNCTHSNWFQACKLQRSMIRAEL